MSLFHLFDLNTTEWADHPTLPGLKIKGLEGRATHPHLSYMLVRVAKGGVIPRHVHDEATETVLIFSGRGDLYLGVDENDIAADIVPLAPGCGASVPPGMYHSVYNRAEEPLEILAIHTPPIR